MPTSDIQSAQLTGCGAVAELERKLREYYGMKHALCVSNATTGLLAVGLALGLRDAEFLTTPYTYGASLAGWLLFGNRPAFADIEPDTLGLAPESLAAQISPRTRALLAVDIFGVPSDTVGLRRIADEHGLWYIADAAQSFGARREDKPASASADALVVSFTARKSLDAGEGGAVITNHSDLYEKLVWWTQHPYRQHRDLGLRVENEFGLNGRIHPCAAIKANAQFSDCLEKVAERRRQGFEILDDLNHSGLTEPLHFRKRAIEPAFFRLTAAWTGTPKSGALRTRLRQLGFEAEFAPSPARLIYRQGAFLAQYEGLLQSVPRCPVAERQAKRRFAVSFGSEGRLQFERGGSR